MLATEDSRFYSHHGIDPVGVARELVGVLHGADPGGATIDQQLAKLLWTPTETGVLAKVEDATLAAKIDARYSKQMILADYLDAAYFGDGSYGVQTAAEHYFGVPADRLSWGQASLLAGLVQAPTAYAPHGHERLAREREAHVLGRLVATGALTRAQAATADAQPLRPRVSFSG